MAIVRHVLGTDVSSTSPATITYTCSTSSNSEVSSEPRFSRRVITNDVATKAIQNHIKFLRSAGKTKVRSDEIAKALSLPIEQVERIASTLQGVKVGL